MPWHRPSMGDKDCVLQSLWIPELPSWFPWERLLLPAEFENPAVRHQVFVFGCRLST